MAAEEESEELKSPFPEWFVQLEEDTAESILYLLLENCVAASKPLTTEIRANLKKKYSLTEQQIVEIYNYLKENHVSDRTVNKVRQPPRNPLPHGLLFTLDGINLSLLKDHLVKEGKLHVKDILSLCQKVKNIFRAESNLIVLQDPITIAGDIHGQFFDLLRLFEVGGDPSKTKYLFLGDYVDRGCFSCEVIFLMFSYKITYPNTFSMLRGNHECRHLSNFFNFKDECRYKYGENLEVYDAIMEVFDCLPLAATINKKFLCVHGGLSPHIGFLEDINKIDRFREIPREGAFCDLLWADPTKEEDADNEYKDWFSPNAVRNCSYKYGSKAVQFFLLKNNLTAIIRGHEVYQDGYQMHFKRRQNSPQVFTIFSAPNYCDVYRNKGSMMKITRNALNIRKFIWSPHPYYLPNFMDVFSWSLPFIGQKVTHMLKSVLETVTSNIENKTVAIQISNEAAVFKEKAVAVIKIMKIYQTLRDEQESIHKLKQLSPNQKLPCGILSSGPQAIQDAIETFSATKEADSSNEALPDTQSPEKNLGRMFSCTSEQELTEMIAEEADSKEKAESSSGLLSHSNELAQLNITN